MALAAALEDVGVTEQASDRRSATARLEEACEIWLRCGAIKDADRVCETMREVRSSLPSQRSVPEQPAAPEISRLQWSSLTKSEMRIIQMVAEGMTNRQIAAELVLSRHTVDTHLRRSFNKLNVRNRVELTRKVLAYEGRKPQRSNS